MQRLINDLLAYSGVGTRGKDFKPTDCRLAFTRAVTNLRTAIEESGAVGGGEQDNLGSQREANRDPPAAGLSLQLLGLGFGQCHSWCCSHLFLLPDEDLANNL